MIRSLRQQGARVPGGFATTAEAYRAYLRHNELGSTLSEWTEALDAGRRSLEDVGAAIRRAIRHGGFPPDIARSIRDA
jgi:pyruvate,water dikinase